MGDPLNVVMAPWAQLGVIGSVVLALAMVCVCLWRELGATRKEHLAEIRACSATALDITIKKIESDNKLADALEGLERVVEAAMGIKK